MVSWYSMETVQDLRKWQNEMLDKAAAEIAAALVALPQEYANPWQNHAVGGNLHNAIGHIAAVHHSISDALEDIISARVAAKLAETPTLEDNQE